MENCHIDEMTQYLSGKYYANVSVMFTFIATFAAN